MKTVTPEMRLKQLISEKEIELQAEGKLLKEQFLLTADSLKPINWIKNSFKDVFAAATDSNTTDASMGLAAGYIAKTLFTGKSQNVWKNIGGIILEILVASNVTKNADKIKSLLAVIVEKIMEQTDHSEKTN